MSWYGAVIVYLGAIVGANLTVARWGTIAVLPVAFICIGLDLTARDYLHDVWHDKLWTKMGLLIGVGALVSWGLNHDAGAVALASFIAFAASALIDTGVYSLLHKRAFLFRVNGSNLFSALADSSLFLTIAFGSFMPVLILAQFGAKVGGGFLWSLVLRHLR